MCRTDANLVKVRKINKHFTEDVHISPFQDKHKNFNSLSQHNMAPHGRMFKIKMSTHNIQNL
jgi:hypothetical protein